MIKLYRMKSIPKAYWETWDNDDGTHTVHWGELGTRGKSKTIGRGLLKSAEKIVFEDIQVAKREGFVEFDEDNLRALIIEYAVEGFGTGEDLDKRHELENRMSETLGWLGLGHCDGGSIGSGSMEVCCFVVDFELAKAAIEDDLKGSVFSDYSRIYLEE